MPARFRHHLPRSDPMRGGGGRRPGSGRVPRALHGRVHPPGARRRAGVRRRLLAEGPGGQRRGHPPRARGRALRRASGMRSTCRRWRCTERSTGRWTRTSPPTAPSPRSDLYARSKREAEAVARAVEAERGLGVTVLRPSAVYGERDRLLTVRLATGRPAARGLPARARRQHHARRLRGQRRGRDGLALEAGRGGATFEVGLDHPLTQRTLLEGLASGLGRSPAAGPHAAAWSERRRPSSRGWACPRPGRATSRWDGWRNWLWERTLILPSASAASSDGIRRTGTRTRWSGPGRGCCDTRKRQAGEASRARPGTTMT